MNFRYWAIVAVLFLFVPWPCHAQFESAVWVGATDLWFNPAAGAGE
jgi:hypothetical protein